MVCIAICGDSASGKTIFAEALAQALGDTLILECDRYHKLERDHILWKIRTHLNPELNKISLMNQHVQDLKSGKSIFARDYDHSTGTFTATHEIHPLKHLVVVGLHTFMAPEGTYDLKIFLDTDTDLKVEWKINRDIAKRGYTIEQLSDQIERRSVDYVRFIKPLKEKADIVVRYSHGEELKVEFSGRTSGEGREALIEYIKNHARHSTT